MKDKIIRKIKNNYRYILILIVFCLAFYYCKNIDPITPYVAPVEKEYSKDLIQKDNANLQQGQFYQVSFTVKGELNKQNTEFYKSSGTGNSVDDGKIPLSLCFHKKDGSKSCENNFTVDLTGKFHTLSSRFQAMDDYERISIERSEIEKSRIAYFSGISVFQLNVNSSIALEKLYPIGAGNSSIEQKVIANDSESGYKPLVNFTRHNMRVGQVFRSNSLNITSLEIMPKIVGSGGDGTLTFELRTADIIDGQVKIGNLLASHDVLSQEIVANCARNQTFRISLPGKLEEGKYYFVGINNDAAIFTNTNFIQLAGFPEKGNNALGVKVAQNGKINSVGNFWFRIFSDKGESYGNKQILNGAVISDLGNNTGRYEYRLQKNQYDLLDVYLAGIKNPVTDRVDFNYENANVIGVGMDQVSYIYKFETIFPANKLFLEMSKLKWTNSDLKASTSVDGVNWQLLDQNNSSSNGPDYQNQFDLHGGNLFFVKIENNISNTSSNIFGLSELNISAELELNK